MWPHGVRSDISNYSKVSKQISQNSSYFMMLADSFCSEKKTSEGLRPLLFDWYLWSSLITSCLKIPFKSAISYSFVFLLMSSLKLLSLKVPEKTFKGLLVGKFWSRSFKSFDSC